MHITKQADDSAKNSSIYVYVTHSGNIGGKTDFEFFEKLANHYSGTYAGDIGKHWVQG